MGKRTIDISERDGRIWPLPGPIVLVTTRSAEGFENVAPKSWLGMVSAEPLMLMFGCNRHHHTAINLLATGECVLNFPGPDLAKLAWDAHRPMAPGPGELQARGFTPIPAEKVRPPRLLECRAHIEGRLESVKWYGDECVLFIEVIAASADEEAFTAADPYAHLRPIFYLAPGTYGVLERGEQVPR